MRRILLSLFLMPLGSLGAQITYAPEWIVGAGVGAVIRTIDQGSLGVNLEFARVVQPLRWLYLEPGVTWQHYWQSPEYGDLCPIEGCPPPHRNAISIVGAGLRMAYRDTRENPVYPVVGAGFYRVSSQDTTGVRFGSDLGVAISLRRSGAGPALDFRYLRIFGDRRFKSVIPVSLRWSF